MKRRILYTEGNCGLRQSTTGMLERNGYKVHAFDKWEIALENYHRRIYEVCLFDESTIEKAIPNLTSTVRGLDPIQPIVILASSEDSSKKRVEAFSDGADVFLKKEDNEEELILRMENLIKHCARAESNVVYKYKIGNACFDYSNYYFQGTQNSPIIHIAQKQRLLLKCLAEHANEGLLKEHLIREVWKGQPVTSKNLSHHLAILRKHLSFNPEISIIRSGQHVTLYVDHVQLIREQAHL